MTLTLERLRDVLSYDPDTGVFVWVNCPKVDRKNKPAGCISKALSYIQIRIEGVTYYGHRLAWLYVTGSWPAHHVDHIDLNRSNNRFANLREATKAENMQNTALRANNSSGYKGVSFNRALNRWHAYVAVDGKRRHIGYYLDLAEASAARSVAAKDLHGVFARDAA